jgi:hypothetical protein
MGAGRYGCFFVTTWPAASGKNDFYADAIGIF